MSILTELERLKTERNGHLAAIQKIDDELNRARSALALSVDTWPDGRPEATIPSHRFKKRDDMTCEEAVLNALDRGPSTINEIATQTGFSPPTIQNHMKKFIRDGSAVRRHMEHLHVKAFAYARTLEQFDGHRTWEEELPRTAEETRSADAEPG